MVNQNDAITMVWLNKWKYVMVYQKNAMTTVLSNQWKIILIITLPLYDNHKNVDVGSKWCE